MMKKLMVVGAVLAVSTLAASCYQPPSYGPDPYAAVCMHSIDAPADGTYLGTPDTLNNVEYHTSLDGSCTGQDPIRPFVTAVWAWDETEAATKCAAIPGAPTDYVYNYQANNWANAPAPLWLCGDDDWSA